MGSLRPVGLVGIAFFIASCTLVLETVPHRTDSGPVGVDGMRSDAMRADVPDVPTGDAEADALDAALDAIDAADAIISVDAPADSIDAHRDVADDHLDAIDVVDATDASDGFDVRFDSADAFDAITRDITATVDASDARLESGSFDVPPDRPAADTGFDTGSVVDSAITDTRPSDSGTDVSAVDAGSIPCGRDSDCFAQWCGCGTCPAEQVFCGTAATASACTLACPGTPICPYTENVTCGCVAGSCAVLSRGGTGDAGSPCTSSTECMSGLLCCYPCGVAGCSTVCMAPDARGGCPLFP